MIKRYGAFAVVLGVALVTGVCEFTDCFRFYRREMEIVPGLRWQYCSDRYSRLIWDKFGIVVEGRLYLTICNYGLDVHSRNDGSFLYLDLLEQRVMEGKDADVNLLRRKGDVFTSIDAATAMGIYTDYGKDLCEQALNGLRDRLQKAQLHRERCDVDCLNNGDKVSASLPELNHFGDDSNPITIKLNEFAEQLQCGVHSAFDNACCVTWQISGPCVFGGDIFADDEGNTNLCVRTSIDVLGIDSRNNRHDVVVGISPYISWHTSIKAGFIRHVMIAKRLFFTDDDNSCRRYANHAARFIEKSLEIARHLSGRTKSVYMCAFGIDPPFDDKKKLLYALFAVSGENMILTYQIGRDGLMRSTQLSLEMINGDDSSFRPFTASAEVTVDADVISFHVYHESECRLLHVSRLNLSTFNNAIKRIGVDHKVEWKVERGNGNNIDMIF